MDSKDRHRINFYSINDMAIPYELEKTEKLLETYTSHDNFDVNDFLEFYNIKIYFDNNQFLKSWDEEKKERYRKIVQTVFDEFKKRLIVLENSNIQNYIEVIEFEYLDNFWELFSLLSLYKKIDGQYILEILKKYNIHIRYILHQKKIVDKYNVIIKEFLLDYEETAEILLTKIEEEHISGRNLEFYFPKNLSLIDKESIIDRYIDSDRPNLNYIRLIENSKDSPQLNLSPKVRLKARKISQKLNNEIIQEGFSWTFRVQVVINKDQKEPVIYKNSNNLLEVVYSESYLNNCLEDDIKLFQIFSELFQYLDETNLIEILSKPNEMDSFERSFMKSKNAYASSDIFNKKEYLSNLQLIIFEDYLKRNNNSIESIINSFVDYLNKRILPSKLYFQIRESDSPYVEKIRSLTPDFDFLLKQFKSLSEEGEIDLDLIQLDSKPFYLSEIHSLNKKKYIYINDDLISYLKYVFFSSQSMLHFIEEYKEKYRCLYDLLVNENINIIDFKNYQKREIEKLINEKFLLINKQGYINIENDIKIFIVGQLHFNEVLNYWNYPKLIRDEIDNMLEQKLLRYENTLFSVSEKNYINYYLNKKEFTNGFDLRNKYMHGTNSFSIEQHKMDYYMLLKIIILTLLKIEDDILISQNNK
ncbi:hypothetical protein [Empedobacter sp.]|uniref:hypothetical protein n=1 Tax=Empedobacter sp. TaxID=1927715 RepID=UPI0028AFBDFE|nr:hypothetical protein [Empedobacter sp.]